MGLGIIGIVFVLLSIIVIIGCISTGDDTGEGFSIFIFILGLFLIITTIVVTKHDKLETNYERQEYLITERQITLDKIDEEHMTSEMLASIQSYNKMVNNNNSKIVKWKSENRSRFEIDYNYYKELFEEQIQAKINEALGD